MAQAHKSGTVDLKTRLTAKSGSNQWIYWVVGGLILVALIVPLALAIPSFMPKSQPSYGNIPTGAEQKAASSGADALPKVSKDERQAMIDGAKASGIEIVDDSNVSTRYEKDTNHAVLSIPTGSGKTFRVKTYRLSKQGDGSWSL